MSELLSLLAVAWVVYISDAAWWIGPRRLLLTGRDFGAFSVRIGPRYAVRDQSGVVFTHMTPRLSWSFELTEPGKGRPATAAEVRQIAGRAMSAAAPLRAMGACLWGFTFAVAPVWIALVGLHRAWLPVVVGLFGGALAIVVMFARAWAMVYPDAPRGWISDGVPMLLAPLGAIRAADKLTRHAVQALDAICVLGVLASDDEFVRVARLLYFEDDVEEGSTAAVIRADLDHVLAARNLTNVFHAPPDRECPGIEGYCPRCRVQVTRGSGCCPDCLTVAILPL